MSPENRPPNSAPEFLPQRRTAVNPADNARKPVSGLNATPEAQYLHILWRRRWLIFFCVLVFLGLGAFQIHRTTPVYTSQAVIKYEPSSLGVVDFGERSTLLYQRDEIRTAVQMVRSPAIAEAVLEELGETVAHESVKETSPLEQVSKTFSGMLSDIRQAIVSYREPEVDEAEVREQDAVRSLLNSVTVVQRSDTKLIEIHARANDPMRAARIANEFCEQFIRYTNEEKRESFSYASEYIAQQLKETKHELEEAEKKLFEYSGQSDLRVMDESRSIAIETMVALSNSVETQRNEVAVLEAEKQGLESEDATTWMLANTEIYQRLVDRRSELEVERLKLVAENYEGFQPVVNLQREIEGIDRQLADAASSFSDAKKGELEIARLKLASLEARLAEQQKAVNELEEQMISFRVLQREVDATRQVFNTLIDQYKRLEVTDDIQPTNVAVVSRAMIPTVPSSPNVTRTISMFAFFGVLMGVGMVAGLTFLDRSVKNPAVIESKLQLPTLGLIPYLRVPRKGLLKSRRQPVALLETNSKRIEAEAFRYLRTSIQYSAAQHPPQVIMVTSCFPQEGKSTVASNLAVIFAERSGRALLIDADLKRPIVHKAFEIPKNPGLSDVLTGQARLEDSIVPSGTHQLDILPAGKTSPSPISLLESQAMDDLIADLRQRYATIIIDSAPAHAMADALVLSVKTDGVVLVVKQGRTLTDVLAHTTDKLRSIGGRVLGAVYNDTRPGATGSSYGYGYGYGYGYTYRYDQRDDDPKDDDKRQQGQAAAMSKEAT